MHSVLRAFFISIIAASMPIAATSAATASVPVTISLVKYATGDRQISTISAAGYIAEDKQISRAASPVSEPYGSQHVFGDVVRAFQEKLKASGQEIQIIDNREDADFRFILNEITVSERSKPPFIPYAPLTPNKHATSATLELITSPWLRAKIYRDANQKIVGGDIFIVWSDLVHLAELFFIANDDWRKAASRPTETADDFLLKYWGSRESSLRKALKVNVDGGPPDKNQECIYKSPHFYLNLYRFYLDALFAPTADTQTEARAGYNFLPTEEALKRIAAVSGKYNCFIRY